MRASGERGHDHTARFGTVGPNLPSVRVRFKLGAAIARGQLYSTTGLLGNSDVRQQYVTPSNLFLYNALRVSV